MRVYKDRKEGELAILPPVEVFSTVDIFLSINKRKRYHHARIVLQKGEGFKISKLGRRRKE